MLYQDVAYATGPVHRERENSEAFASGNVALMQSPSHSTARLSPIEKTCISRPWSTTR